MMGDDEMMKIVLGIKTKSFPMKVCKKLMQNKRNHLKTEVLERSQFLEVTIRPVIGNSTHECII